MNKQQIIDILKGLTVAGGFLPLMLVQFGILEPGPAEKISQGVGALLSIAGVIWLGLGRTDTNILHDAAQVDGVQKIKIDPATENKAALDVAADQSAIVRNVRLGETPTPPKGT